MPTPLISKPDWLQPSDPDFNLLMYGQKSASDADPVASAKSYLAQPDVLDPTHSNADTALNYLAEHGMSAPTGEAPITHDEAHGYLSGLVNPGTVGAAALLGANALAPEIALPAEFAVGGGAGALTALAKGNNPLVGAAEGAANAIPFGKALEWGGRGLQAATEAMPPWWGREMIARLLGLGEVGQAAAVAAPPVAGAVGRGMEAAGQWMGNESWPSRVVSWLRDVGAPKAEQFAPNVSGYAAEEGAGAAGTRAAEDAFAPGNFRPSTADIERYTPNVSGYRPADVPMIPEEPLPTATPIERYAPNTGGQPATGAPQQPAVFTNAPRPSTVPPPAATPASISALTPEDIGSAVSGEFRSGASIPTSANTPRELLSETTPTPTGTYDADLGMVLPHTPQPIAEFPGVPQEEPTAADVQKLVEPFTGPPPTSPSLRALERGDEFWGPGSKTRAGAPSLADESNRLLYDPQTPTAYLRQQLKDATDPQERAYLAKALDQRYRIARRPGKTPLPSLGGFSAGAGQ